MINKTLLVSCMAVVLTGCGGGSGSSTTGGIDGFTMPEAAEAPAVGAASAAATSTTPSAISVEAVSTVSTVEEASPYVAYIEVIGEDLVPVPETVSSEITTEALFLFDTSTKIRLMVDMSDVVGEQGNISICTDFDETDDGYKINYSSCAIRGLVQDGQFEQELDLMNQFDSAVGVIWFKNRLLEPRYHKFVTADLVDGPSSRDWIWN